MVVKTDHMPRAGELSMRYLISVILLVAVTACAPSVPNSGAGAGVGFDSYNDFEKERAEREQLLAGTGPNVGANAISDEQIVGGTTVPT
jgi:hypothetical protein